MVEWPILQQEQLADELLDILPQLLQQLRADVPQAASSQQGKEKEWHDVSELRATSGQFRLLRILIRRQSCTMQELADELFVTPPTATGMVKRLLTQGYVERLRDEADWRVVRVLPTERGRRAIQLYDQIRRTSLLQRVAHLSCEEYIALRAALPALHHLIEVNEQ
jgi:DNA-binding MarR family transcriptional regulator